MARPLIMSQFAPVRCFFSEIQDRIAQNDGRRDIKFRLLGSVVGFSTAERLETTTTMTTTTTAAGGVLLAPPESPADDSRLVARLDDGTALVKIIVTTKMAKKLKLQEGMLVECIAAVVMKRRPAYTGSDYPAPPSPAPPASSSGAVISDDASGSTFSLIGEQVAVITDTNAETLRWMELCYRQEQGQEQRRRRQQQSRVGELVIDSDGGFTQEWLGYPTRRVAAEDLFRIIEYQCEFDDADVEEDNKNKGHHKKAPAPSAPKGVSAEQLKIAFHLTSEQVQTLLNALQVRWDTYMPLSDISQGENILTLS
jgi:hypothetical protein